MHSYGLFGLWGYFLTLLCPSLNANILFYSMMGLAWAHA